MGERRTERSEIVVNRKYSGDIKKWISLPEVEKFRQDCQGMGISLSERQLGQFAIFTDMLLSWNEVMNLTAITALPDILQKHYLDSCSLIKIYHAADDDDEFCSCRNEEQKETEEKTLAKIDQKAKEKAAASRSDSQVGEESSDAAQFAPVSEKVRLIDVGTGAGFPGIPLAICFPDMEIVLMDSLKKRVDFLNHVIDELGLLHVSAVHARAEELAHNKGYREKFDLCCSRAVADLRVLSEYCIPFLKKDGYFVSYKSEKLGEELPAAERAISVLGGKVTKQVSFSLGEEAQQRVLLVIQKRKETPKKYPRKAGTPAKEPIA